MTEEEVVKWWTRQSGAGRRRWRPASPLGSAARIPRTTLGAPYRWPAGSSPSSKGSSPQRHQAPHDPGCDAGGARCRPEETPSPPLAQRPRGMGPSASPQALPRRRSAGHVGRRPSWSGAVAHVQSKHVNLVQIMVIVLVVVVLIVLWGPWRS